MSDPRITLLREALRWAEYCAEEGMCREIDGEYVGPEDFLMDYSMSSGDDDWGNLSDSVLKGIRFE